MKRAGLLAALGVVLALVFISASSARTTASPALDPAITPTPAVTVITVNDGRDFNASLGETCDTEPECTLRRAIVQARTAPKPVVIEFDIPKDPVKGWDPVEDVWMLNVKPASGAVSFRQLTGETTIDGTTQSRGRINGPRIFVVSDNPQSDLLVLGENQSQGNNKILGLGFQNFGVAIKVTSDNNEIAGNWFGLNIAGTAPVLRNDASAQGSGETGVELTETADDNSIESNRFLGLLSDAATLRGKRNIFQANYVGLRADGTAPLAANSERCTNSAWLGGSGVSIFGASNASAADGNRIVANILTGLRQDISPTATQRDAIKLDGDHHVIQDNLIGIDVDETWIGVCGRGIYIGGSNTAEDTEVSSNFIANPGLSAISVNGALSDANKLSGNIIIQENGWSKVDVKDKPETAIEIGKSTPSALQNFLPAQVIKIDGTAVTGASGEGSPCPNCIIELFLDDTDSVTEAKKFLLSATAKDDGTWTATLPALLQQGEGLRTTSTTKDPNVIPGMSAGTTTRLSEGKDGLYTEVQPVYLPAILK